MRQMQHVTIAAIALFLGCFLPYTRAQQVSDVIGTWVVRGGTEAFQFEPDGAFEYGANFSGTAISEVGRFKVAGRALTVYPTRKAYRQPNSGWQPDATIVRTYTWSVLCDSVVDRRVLRLTIGATATDLHADGPGARCGGVEEDLRPATHCVTPSMTCTIDVRGVHKVGDLCSCPHPVTGIAMDYGRATKSGSR